MLVRLILLVLLAACSPARVLPSQRVSLGGERDFDPFDTPETNWDTFTVPGDLALFRVNAGRLEGAVVADRGYIWSLNNAYYTNVAVGAVVQQTRGSIGNGFGLLCRADAEGNGYYFVISSAGQFAILRATPANDDPEPLVPWQDHPAIRRGFEPNELAVICANDYLAFSVNEQFLAETRDDTFDGGALGVVVGATGETAWVSFDSIRVRDALLRN